MNRFGHHQAVYPMANCHADLLQAHKRFIAGWFCKHIEGSYQPFRQPATVPQIRGNQTSFT